MKKALLLISFMGFLQGCSTGGAAIAGLTGTGIKAVQKTRTVNTNAMVSIAALQFNSQHAALQQGAIDMGLPIERMIGLPLSIQQQIVDGYNEREQGRLFVEQAKAISAAIKHSTGALSDDAQLAKQYMAGINQHTVSRYNTIDGVIGAVGSVAKIGGIAHVMGKAMDAAGRGNTIKGDGNTFNQTNESFDYAPSTTGDNSAIAMGDYKGSKDGIPLAEGNLADVALGEAEGSTSSGLCPDGWIHIPDENRCSDGNGGSIDLNQPKPEIEAEE